MQEDWAKTPNGKKRETTHVVRCETEIFAAIREDRTPNLLLMRYALATWEVRDLLLIPSFMLTAKAPSAPSSEPQIYTDKHR